jgi:hypothetical protein
MVEAHGCVVKILLCITEKIFGCIYDWNLPEKSLGKTFPHFINNASKNCPPITSALLRLEMNSTNDVCYVDNATVILTDAERA